MKVVVVHKNSKQNLESFHTDTYIRRKKYLPIRNCSKSMPLNRGVLHIQHQNMSSEWPRFHNAIYRLYVV